MSPDAEWVGWTSFAAAIIQALAALLQLRLGRRAAAPIRGISAGVKFGLAALVFEFFGWLIATRVGVEATALRLAGYSPAITFGGLAFFGCIGHLIMTPEMPEPPHAINFPLSGNRVPYEAEIKRRQMIYERGLLNATITPGHAFSLLLGAAGGLAVAYTSLHLAGAFG